MAGITTVVFLLVVVIVLSTANAAVGLGGFEEWCGRTTRNAVCLEIIRNDPRSNLKNDPSGFCTILGDRAKSAAGSTYKKIRDALNHATDPVQKQELQTCLDVYDEIIAILTPLDFSSLTHQKFQFLNLSLQKARQGTSECKAPSFAAEDNYLVDVATATSDILNLNECNKIAC